MQKDSSKKNSFQKNPQFVPHNGILKLRELVFLKQLLQLDITIRNCFFTSTRFRINKNIKRLEVYKEI